MICRCPQCEATDTPDVMEWQDISTAPKDGSTILIYAHTSGRKDYRWFIGRAKADTTFYKKRADWYALPLTHGASHALLFNATHWMPLPNPPKENE